MALGGPTTKVLARSPLITTQLTTSVTIASVATTATTTNAVTVTGAALGDFAQVSFATSLAGLVVNAYVSAADTVTIVTFNPTAGTINRGADTARIMVIAGDSGK